MKERPILFKSEMVRAILDGRKTMTRRIVKRQPCGKLAGPNFDGLWSDTKDPVVRYFGCPYGSSGDHLWVKETWQSGDVAQNEPRGPVYCATDPDWETTEGWKRKPSIFMPRSASRITLEITGVRCERLNSISEDDAKAEGVTIRTDAGIAAEVLKATGDSTWGPAKLEFWHLWEGINGKGSWEESPWVWVISFRRVQPIPADLMIREFPV